MRMAQLRYAAARQYEQSPWPTNRFGNYATIAELLTESTHAAAPRPTIAIAARAHLWIMQAVDRQVSGPHWRGQAEGRVR